MIILHVPVSHTENATKIYLGRNVTIVMGTPRAGESQRCPSPPTFTLQRSMLRDRMTPRFAHMGLFGLLCYTRLPLRGSPPTHIHMHTHIQCAIYITKFSRNSNIGDAPQKYKDRDFNNYLFKQYLLDTYYMLGTAILILGMLKLIDLIDGNSFL